MVSLKIAASAFMLLLFTLLLARVAANPKNDQHMMFLGAVAAIEIIVIAISLLFWIWA